MIAEFVISLIAILAFAILYIIIEEIIISKPKRVQRVPRKRRKMNKLLDERWGGLFEVVKTEKIGVDYYLLHLRNRQTYLKVPYYSWEIRPLNNVEALTSQGVAIWEWIGNKKNKKTSEKLAQLSRDAQILRKKVVEKEAYERKLAHDILGEAHRFVKAEKEYKYAKS